VGVGRVDDVGFTCGGAAWCVRAARLERADHDRRPVAAGAIEVI
jgi:hypothetical protein